MRKPEVGIIKLSVDAAFDSQTDRAGSGGVFRDHECNFVAGLLHSQDDITSVNHAELLAQPS